ncbi:hypothetical protein HNY73_015655, partial [Argiope bruennichi]
MVGTTPATRPVRCGDSWGRPGMRAPALNPKPLG